MSSQTSIVRFNILTILAGLGIQTAIAIMVDKPDPGTIMCGVVFLTLVTNFYHAKVLTTESCEETRSETVSSAVALAEYWLNICVWLAITFMSFYINRVALFLVWNIVLCVIDAFLVVMNRTVRRRAIVGPLLLAHKVWFWFDLALSAIAAGILAAIARGLMPDLVASIAICGGIVITTLGDYWINRQLYFGAPSRR